jgi:L-fuculose-phosphate aldolase
VASHLIHPRDEILQSMERIYRYRMTTTSGGNLSIREPSGDVWITPARVDKGSLGRADIVLVRADGTVEGRHPPSSELPLHQAIYRARPDVSGIVHAHPVALVAFSIVHQVPNTRLFHQAWHVCGEGGFAPYALPGTVALGENIAGAFANGHHCVILENHGVVAAGESLQQAFRRFETFEFTGKTIIKARLLGRDVRYLTDEEIERGAEPRGVPEFRRAEIQSQGPSSEEKELRGVLRDFVHRAYRLRLFISTQGSFSARLDGHSFVITPTQADRERLGAEDLALIHNGKAESGSTPSRAASLHDAIYRRHPHVGAIINAYPVNATAFSVTGAELETRTIPESYVVVRKPGIAGYAMQFAEPDALAGLISATQPALLVRNGGVLVTGRNVLEAYDRLEVLESTAEAIINSRALGTIVPMSGDAIQELEAAFLRPGC